VSDVGVAGWWVGLPALDPRLPTRWQHWALSVLGIETLARWALEDRALSGWSNEELVSPVGSGRTDTMQAALVSLAQGGSAEAGLTLLVQLRPGLIRLARTAANWEWIRVGDINEEVQATFFETLFRHDLGRRGHKIAANLLLDTRQKMWRSQPRSGPPTISIGDEPSPGHRPVPQVDEVGLWLHLREAVRDLPGSDESRQLTATMAYRAWIEEESSTTIARDLGVAPQTVSTRLYRLRRILRASW